MTVFYIQCLLLLLSMAQTRAAQDNDEGSNESSNRTTWNIIWSCLATIFACTWLAVHPNVPSRHMRKKGRLFLGLHRVKHMLLAIVCPEAVIMWAFRQRLVASRLFKDLGLPMTHGFFISMGGFVGKDDHPITPDELFLDSTTSTYDSDTGEWLVGEDDRPITPDGLFPDSTTSTYDFPPPALPPPADTGEWRLRLDVPDISRILSITEEELMDKSKGDALSKSISLLQTTWFVVQYFSRIILSLPTTPLETATLAFALLNFCNYILWWHKPLDVQYPLNCLTIPSDSTRTSTLQFFGNEEPEPSIPLVQLPARVWNWYRQILGSIVISDGTGPVHTTNATLPMLWAGQPRTPSQIGYSAFFGGCFGALFGGVHCIEWSSSGFFDSSLERLLWKFSSLLVAIVPVILALEVLTLLVKPRWISLLMRLSSPVFIFIYICARVYLLVDMFVSLRSLPPGALEEIDWTRYIPHI